MLQKGSNLFLKSRENDICHHRPGNKKSSETFEHEINEGLMLVTKALFVAFVDIKTFSAIMPCCNEANYIEKYVPFELH